MTNRLELNWKLDGFVDEQRYYCSETAIDVNNLPLPKAVLAGDVRFYVDTDIDVGKTYYVAVGSVKNGVERLSEVRLVRAVGGDEYWDKVVALLHFDGDLTDEVGGAWDNIGSPSITDTNHLFDKNLLFSGNGVQHIEKTFVDALGTDDFTIEMFIRRAAHSDYRCIFDSRSGMNIDGIAIYTSSILTGNVPIIWTNTQVLSGVSEIPHSEWVHIAVCRRSGTLYYFTGGILQNSANFTNNLTNKSVRLGAQREGFQSYGGHIDELRITKGLARYTEDFVPPTEPFPNN